jgi:hypothetical protein
MPTTPNNTTIYAAPVIRKIADVILHHPLKTAILTIEKLAELTECVMPYLHMSSAAQTARKVKKRSAALSPRTS